MTIESLSYIRQRIEKDLSAIIRNPKSQSGQLLDYLKGLDIVLQRQLKYALPLMQAIDCQRMDHLEAFCSFIQQHRSVRPHTQEDLEMVFHHSCRLQDAQYFDYLLKVFPEIIENQDEESQRIRIWGMEYAAQAGAFLQMDFLKPYAFNENNPDSAMFMAAQSGRFDMVDYLWPPYQRQNLLHQFRLYDFPGDEYDKKLYEKMYGYIASRLAQEEIDQKTPFPKTLRPSTRL